MKAKIFALAAALMVAGCQTVPRVTEPLSFVFPADKQTTKEAIAATFLQNGYQIQRESDLQLVMDRPAKDSFAAQLIFGSEFNIVPDARVLMTILGDKPTVVTTNLQIVTNPGSGFEQATDITQNTSARAAIQQRMSAAIALAESEQKPPKAKAASR